ncbi:DUF2167 domain-containing protein [Mucilaginibacter psychrotolerans]|uniref:DUF2167 domain-containing protein n=1 Tax=Mucilaginibacter psychrotolerans TaxID=1524096 RepID=A0A4Y8SDB0_9SPHI|nr:DUF2167 domain-containing protein [Mucilaginibacter psychrotolerans]TFF37083.1 DUF2167 domain-containing protein [Mucilaginibacter psychrotolerans]
MKKLYALIVLLGLYAHAALAQDSTAIKTAAFEKQFTYQHGTIKVGDGIATVTIPKGFKYLDSVQAAKVLTDVWGNPKTPTLGFIMPEENGILSGYVFNIQYDAIGYVKDDDAKDVDYDELLANLKTESNEENPEREKAGFPPITIIGWAAKPYYDGDKHILHWAKEVKFGTDSVNTLNYNVRVLGRKGVLILNAIATMNELEAVKSGVPQVLTMVEFSDGNKYTNFNSSIDNVAAWTIGGLVAGKILAKVGFFALAVKFWKVIALGFAVAGGAIKKFFTGKSNKAATTPAEDEKEPIAAFDDLAEQPKEEEPKNEEEPPGIEPGPEGTDKPHQS